MRSALSVLLSACILPVAFAQYAPQRLDSVLRELDRPQHDTARIELLILASESWFTSPKAYPYLEELAQVSERLAQSPDTTFRERALHGSAYHGYFIGYHAKFERNVPLGLHSFRQALAHFTALRDTAMLAECHDALGVLLQAAGDPAQAQAQFRRELLLARARGNTRQTIQALVHLAACERDLGRIASAHALLDSCPPGSPADRSLALLERARTFLEEHDTTMALQVLEQSLGAAAASDNEWDKLPVLTVRSRVFLQRGRTHEALEDATRCAELAGRMNDRTAQCGCIVLQAYARRDMAEPEKADALLAAAQELAIGSRNVGSAREAGDEGSQLAIADLWRRVLADMGRERDARMMTERWALLKDSVAGMDGRDEILAFEFRTQALRDSMHYAQRMHEASLAHERDLSRERGRRYLFIGLASMALLTGSLLWARVRTVRRANKAILEAQDKFVESERAREAGEVRTRIARDIHDDIGSGLTKIAMLGSEARQHMQEHSEELRTTLERIIGHSREVNAALSDIVWSVDPTHDTSEELVHHARNVAQRLLEGSGVAHELRFDHTGPSHPVAPGTKHHVVMVMKEAINNALKYADAKHINVHLEAGAHRVKLVVADDGKGFDPGAMARAGNGLRNMRARAETIGADLRMESAEGKGCAITLAGKLA
ncbi:MAG: ATP-binding protein [Flavobacteriales bacterium]|nr:ATP-binding protein [Flavobacteriales bacterium]